MPALPNGESAPGHEPPGRSRTRLADVARRAEVAKGTASRILNGDTTLVARPETWARVLAAAAELGYRPHPVARALATSGAQAIALLVPSVGNPAFAPVIRAAQRRAHELGYILMTAEDPDDQLADEAFARLVREGRIDGLIIASARPDHKLVELLEGSQYYLPHVFLYREVLTSRNNVHLDIRQSARLAAEYLLSLGHRCIGHVGGPAGNLLWTNHAEAFREVAEAGGARVVVERASFAESAGAHAASAILGANTELTALYASSLVQAAGVLADIRSRARAVPSDISVLAYDEIPLAEYLFPPLTTVAVRVERLGVAAVDALMARFQGAEPHDIEVDCEPAIVVRSSTGPVPR